MTPEGAVRRLKLLSNGRRRASAVVVPQSGEHGTRTHNLRVHQVPAWCVPALVGCSIRVGAHSAVQRVIRAEIDRQSDTAIVAIEGPPSEEGSPRESSSAARTIEIWNDREAPVWAAHLLTGTPLGRALPPHVMQLSTTRGTNALLEGEPRDVGLVTNDGLEGLLAVGTQQRLGIFDLVARKPPVLAGSTLGVRARLAADGRELQPVDRDEVRAMARALRALGVRHVAIALMHSWRDSSHECAVAEQRGTVGESAVADGPARFE